jgi:hypothetical protein
MQTETFTNITDKEVQKRKKTLFQERQDKQVEKVVH